PAPATEPVTETTVDGFDVSVEGDLTAGEASQLTMTVTRDGEPVTELEPYLGAFGHLVALRDGDLSYLHVHPHGDEPQAGETSGPEIVLEATAPTESRYLLYLDFQVDGEVHTAPLVTDTTSTSGGNGTGGHSANESGQGPDSDSAEGHAAGAGHDRGEPQHGHRRYRTADRWHDLRLLREPDREEAQQARRRHRERQLRDREGQRHRPRRPGRAGPDRGGRE